jgi:hypothetical protein
MKYNNLLKDGYKIGLFLFAMLYCTFTYGYKDYFQAGKSGARLENSEGTQYLVFEYPGKSAKDLYQRAMVVLKGSTAKEESLENTSIDFYKDECKMGENYFTYKYSVKFKDGKVRVDNPSVRFRAIYPGKEGFITVSEAIASNEEMKNKDKEKNRGYYDNIAKLLNDDFGKLVIYFNMITDNLVEGLKESNEDGSGWTITNSPMAFTLTPEGVKNGNNSDYFAFEVPGKSKAEIETKVTSFMNLINTSSLSESQFSKELLSGWESEDVFKLTYQWPTGLYTIASTTFRAGPYQTISIKSDKLIRAPKTIEGNIGYDLDIVYADGKIKIKNPVITYLSQEITGGYEMVVGYKFINVKTGIFNEKDGSVLYPEHKRAIEEHFDRLYSLIRKYLVSGDFERTNEW